ncbi:MAG: group II intron reverse transcriptase domain-containing protein [Candidatus Melainabacteria bacterium]|nr:group II intron reverse transcriptase domain-containing protein [Candidatus Melainabacteria bacterium]
MTGKLDGWYRTRTYAHFDVPMSHETASAYVTVPANVRRHPFLPFLSFEMRSRRIHKPDKIRPIKYSSHKDSHVYSYYGSMLSSLYEKQLQEANLGDVVLAYRSGIGNNITFAGSGFDSIEKLGNCVAIGIDIAEVFDQIDHELLKREWMGLLETTRLPDDHYAVYRSLTKYAYVDREQCYEALGYSGQQIKRKKPICSLETFHSRIKGRDGNSSSLIQVNQYSHGIPQGSPMSAVLANIYLYSFDKAMTELADTIGGVYRRYSDDILWIAPCPEETNIICTVEKELARLKLKVQEGKTTISHFGLGQGNNILLKSGDKPFQYLGFTFDGQRRLLRSQTLSRYWRKTTFAVKKAKRDARKAGGRGLSNKIFLRKLYRRFSHLGHNNFISYARRSSKIMSGGQKWKDSPSWKQVSKHWDKLHDLLQ